jgi:hypothetical protein
MSSLRPAEVTAGSELEQALHRLVISGVLTAAQAAAVREELASSAPGPSAAPGRAPLAGRLAEVAAYAGAVLVGAAAMLLVGQQWDQLGRPGRALLLGAVTLVLAAAGLVAARAQPRGRAVLRQPAHAVRRRFASTALSLAAAAAAGTVAVLLVDHQLLVYALIGVAAIALAQWVAPSAVSELAAVGAVCLLAGAVVEDTSAEITTAVLVFAVGGAIWVGLSRTGALTQPTLALSLGLGIVVTAGAIGAFYDAAPAEPVGTAILALVTVGGLATYLRLPHWPFAAAAVAALALIVLSVTNDRLGPAIGVLLTGLVLLAGSGLVLLRRRAADRADQVPRGPST